MIPVLLKAALPKIRPGSELPDLSLVRHDVPLDPRHVARYAEVCGFPRKDTLPLSYPHLLAFGLHMEIMTDGSFPFPAIGTVHLENSITQYRPIGLDEKLQVTARPDHLRPHPKGQVFDMLTTVHSRGDLVWEETSTFLRRGRGSDDAPGGSSFPEAPSHGITWRLPGDLGRRYAGVSGDHNPIHLYPLTAKAFGFPRQIAHGMWTMARCVAALENRLPDAVTVAVAFKKPVLLPGTVAFGARAVDDGWAFSLSSPKSGAPHLAGLASPA
jgi:acyl dehydratase